MLLTQPPICLQKKVNEQHDLLILISLEDMSLWIAQWLLFYLRPNTTKEKTQEIASMEQGSEIREVGDIRRQMEDGVIVEMITSQFQVFITLLQINIF